MARHPARELISEGVILDTNPDELTDEEKLFFQFRDDARDTDAQPDLLIWRLNIDPRTDKPRSSDAGAFCTDTPMDSFKSFNELLSWIRDTYGAGYYRVTGRMRQKDGLEKTHFNRVVRIAAPVSAPGTEATQTTGNDFSKMLAAIHAMNAQSEKNMENMLRMVANMSRKPDNEVSPEKIAQWIGAGAAILGQLKGLFAPASATPMQGLAGMIQEFKTVQELIGGGGAPGAGTNDSDVMNTLIKTFGPVIAQMLMQGSALKAAQALPAPVAALPKPNPAPPAPHTPEPDVNPLLVAFKANIQQLIAQAKAGTPPDAVAHFVIDSNDEDKIDQLVELCEREDAVAQLIALVPEVADHREWFEAFRLAVVNAFSDDEEPAPEPVNGGTAH